MGFSELANVPILPLLCLYSRPVLVFQYRPIFINYVQRGKQMLIHIRKCILLSIIMFVASELLSERVRHSKPRLERVLHDIP